MLPKLTTYNEYVPLSMYRYAHVKRDGHHVRVERDKNGLLRLFRRTTELTALSPELIQPYLNLPPSSTALCELWIPGRKASAVASYLAGNLDVPARLDCFATSIATSSDPLEFVAWRCWQCSIPFVPYYRYGRKGIEHGLEGCIGTFQTLDDLTAIRLQGPDIEGFVLKRSNLKDWAKWIPVKTIDLIVTGVKDGNGQHAGLLGSLECSTIEGHVVANVSGMNRKDRIALSEQWLDDELLGQVVEVEYREVGDGGRLRFPQFVRARDDKPETECTINQDPDLEGYYS